jgi:ribosomal protein S18 acetylase RimI-like enzyme
LPTDVHLKTAAQTKLPINIVDSEDIFDILCLSSQSQLFTKIRRMDADSTEIAIRRPTPQDAEVLAQMGEATFARSYECVISPKDLADYTADAFSVDQIRAELNNPAIIYFLATCKTTPCGYAKLEPTPLPGGIDMPKPIDLARLYASLGWTGKGIGTKLTEAGLEAAVGAGYQSCWLRVWDKNERAIEFYRRWGFSTAGAEPYFVGQNSETVLIMTRPLTDLYPRPKEHA